MNFFDIVEKIFNKFGYEISIVSKEEAEKNAKAALNYGDISKINFTAIFSKKLATLTVSDCDFAIAPDNKRAELMGEVGERVWGKIKKITSIALGTGGCVIVPYVKKGKLYYSYVGQNRLFIHEENGELITGATIIAESTVVKNRRYLRLADYKVINNTLYIRNKAVDAESGNDAVVEKWKDITDITIQNVDRVPFGYIKSPVDNRESSDCYGVPVTYGCESTIEEIYECLIQVRKEFKNKKVRVQVDPRCFDRDEKGNYKIKDNVFVKGFNVTNDNLFNVFDPAIRDSSYYNRLENLFAQLEKEIGTSRGILTEPNNTYENSQKIREAVGATFAIVADIRKAIEKAFNDFLYACDILANYYNLTPQGEYVPKFDWDYSMVESNTEKWNQMKDGVSMSIRSRAEARAWQTGETLEEAQKKIEEIDKNEPSLQKMLGMSE